MYKERDYFSLLMLACNVIIYVHSVWVCTTIELPFLCYHNKVI